MRRVTLLAVVACVPVLARAGATEVPAEAVAPYTAGSHPRVALKWGMEALPRINELRLAAARKAAASQDCDRVSAADLFDLRSESAEHWTIAVECINGRRFLLRQSDLTRR